jgi:hypothetical protein
VFELALFAYLREQSYDLDRSTNEVDFLITGETPAAIEACTSNPVQTDSTIAPNAQSDSMPNVPTDLAQEQREFVFQAGKAIRRKITKRNAAGLHYWQLPRTVGTPFLIALQAFHSPSALFNSVGALAEYLYGRRDVASRDADGHLTLIPTAIASHEHAGRSIPSALFAQPDAASLSGVLFSNSGTVSVFNRIGTQMGYSPPDVALARVGTIVDHDPNATEPHLFAELIEPVESDQRETFGESLHLLHNPHALVRLPADAIRGVTEHRLLSDGRLLATFTRPSPFVSLTQTFVGSGARRYALDWIDIYVAGIAQSD